MRRSATRITAGLAACVAATGVALASPSADAASSTGYAALSGSVASGVSPQSRVAAVPAAQRLSVHLWLTPNTAAAERFATAVSTPGSGVFHHYLSPSAYTSRFAASPASASAVRAWLSGQGFTGVHADAQRNYVTGTAPVAKVQSAFHVTMNQYRVQNSDGSSSVIESNDREISVPRSLSADVLAVTGLNSTKPQTLHTQVRPLASSLPPGSCSQYWGQRTVTVDPPFKGHAVFTKANCGYSAGQLRAAYGMNTASIGTGQRVALIEVGTPYAMLKTLMRYASMNGLPAPSATQYQELAIGRGNACGNPFDIEEQLDSESVFAMAPGASQLLVGGDSCNFKLEGVQPLFDAQVAVLDGNGGSPLASIESNSWGITGGETFPRAYLLTSHSIMVRAAAEGVTMAVSSGDNPGVSLPASDPYALAVGGTTLGIGRHDERIFETGWSNDDAVEFQHKWLDLGIGRDAAGGGRSLIFAEPDYQKGVVPNSMTHIGVGSDPANRVLPDISADADANTGILQIDTIQTKKGDRFVEFVDGGTSLSSPLVAGMLADAQQGQSTAFGFVNPAVYSLAGTSALHDTLPVTSSTPPQNAGAYCPRIICGLPFVSLFDSQLRAYTDQATKVGYDTMTGVGTPAGQSFITALRAAVAAG